jgi:hypothetical protein
MLKRGGDGFDEQDVLDTINFIEGEEEGLPQLHKIMFLFTGNSRITTVLPWPYASKPAFLHKSPPFCIFMRGVKASNKHILLIIHNIRMF